MEVKDARRSIIVNTLWGKANIGVRYLTSFVATSIIAAKYSPSDFGYYQLILTYLGILEVINLLHPNHIRNHLVAHPEDEQMVSSIWYFQSFGVWGLSSLGIVVCALSLEDSRFWWLLLLANVRFLSRAYEYVQIVADYRLRNELTQKAQMMVVGSFNIVRTLFALLSMPMGILVSSSAIQGVLVSLYQLKLQKNLGFSLRYMFDLRKYLHLVRDGAWLSGVLILGGIQMRIVPAMVAEKMSPQVFGNFQLVLKLVEPATAVGAVVLAANYTVLAHTLRESHEKFIKRFLKVSSLSVLVAALCGLIIIIFPKEILLKVFGSSYIDAIKFLWVGAGIILAHTILSISAQYDSMTRRYKWILFKYAVIFLSYVGALSWVSEVKMLDALLLQIAVPIGVVAGLESARCCLVKIVSVFRS